MAGQTSGNMDMYQNMHPIRVKRLGCISAFTARLPMMRKAADAVRGCNKSVPMCCCMNKYE